MTRERDEGTAVVEFIVVVVLILVPLAYAAVIVTRLHSASAGVILAAREASRAYVGSDTTAEAAAAARQAASIALADQGVTQQDVRIKCLRGSCLSPASRVRVEVTTRVQLPFLSFLGDRAAIPVTSVQEADVDTYREEA